MPNRRAYLYCPPELVSSLPPAAAAPAPPWDDGADPKRQTVYRADRGLSLQDLADVVVVVLNSVAVTGGMEGGLEPSG
jgi:hypothetical protein